MSAVVDTSVVLAAVLGEPGGALDVPGEIFHLSIVNLAEVHTKIAERGGSIEDVRRFLAPLPIRFRSFRDPHAEEVGRLRPLTRHLGLSLGDRACVALARLINLPVLTAGRRWLELDLGIEIRLIR